MKNGFKKSVLILLLGISGMVFCGQEAEGALTEMAKEIPLINAVQKVNLEEVRELIDAGADVNQRDQKGFAALWYAVESGNPHMVNMLLNNGAEIDMIFPGGRTALSKAVEMSSNTVFFVLLKAGADLNIPDNEGNTPLMIAALKKQGRRMKHLLYDGAFMLIKNKKGESALEMVREMSKDEYGLVWDLNSSELFIKELAQHLKDGSVDEQLTRQRLSLVNAAGMQALEKAKAKGAPEAADAWVTPITTAIWTCVDEDEVYAVVKELIALGENINREDIYGDTPLMDAILHNYARVMKLLLDNGADIQQVMQKYRYNSALGLIYANSIIVERAMSFLGKGISVIKAKKSAKPKNTREKKEICTDENVGKTPLEYARKKGYSEIVAIIEAIAPDLKQPTLWQRIKRWFGSE